MSALSEKIRKAREIRVSAGGFTFVARRPTDLEMLALRGTGAPERILPFVIGWEGVKELDLIAGGDPHPLAFDADACAEWLADRPDLFGPVVDGIIGAYQAHATALEDAAKN